jgi:predicted DNA-binding transcriptional regulator YafY
VGQTERLYKIEALLRTRRVVSSHHLREECGVTRATLNRDLALLRDRLNAPIVYDRNLGGYRLGDPKPGETRHELPGLWFSSRELHALLAFHHFLEHLEPGLLSPHIAPLKERIQTLLEGKDRTPGEITRRIRILAQATRSAEPACFRQVAHALLTRQRLRFQYHGRGRGDISERRASPQRLVHYRDNWYLDAWDHAKRALRTFAVERIREPQLLDQRTKDVLEANLDRHFTTGYGIFAGRPKRKAVLRFSPERARWVAEERWHPEQKGRYDGNHYLLEIPYSDDRELVLDILKYGPDVEVLSPKSLRKRVLEQHLRAVEQYQGTTPRSHRARQHRS